MATKRQSWRPAYIARPIGRRQFLASAAGALGAVTLAACASDDDGGGTGTGGTGATGGDNGSAASGGRLEGGSIWYARDDYKLSDESDQAVPGGVYPGFYAQDIAASLDPYLDVDAGNLAATGAVYEYLVRPNRGPGVQIGTPAYSEIMPNLAVSWEISDDAMQYTFKLRKGVKFHNLDPVNGREMDIEDWRASHDRFVAEAYYRNTLAAVLDRVEFPDGETMVYKMKEPYGFLTTKMSSFSHYNILPRELHEDGLARTKAIGTNFRILDNRQASVATDFRQNPEYWRGRPFIDRWQYPIIPEYANRYAQFVAKQVHSFTPSATDALRMRSDAGDAVMVVNDPATDETRCSQFGFQLPPEPFRDERVRIAMRRSVDWDSITDFVSNKAEFEAAGIAIDTTISTHVAPDPAFWLDPRKGELGEASANYLFDLAEAKKLMEAAGYADGADIEAYTSAAYTGTQLDRTNISIDQWAKSGLFRVNLNAVTAEQWTSTYVVEFDYVGLIPNIARGGDMDYYLFRNFHSEGNTNPFPDLELDELTKAQRREIDTEKRNEIFRQIQRQLATKFYTIPADGNVGTYDFEWPWVHNVVFPIEFEYGHQWWLDESMPNRNG